MGRRQRTDKSAACTRRRDRATFARLHAIARARRIPLASERWMSATVTRIRPPVRASAPGVNVSHSPVIGEADRYRRTKPRSGTAFRMRPVRHGRPRAAPIRRHESRQSTYTRRRSSPDRPPACRHGRDYRLRRNHRQQLRGNVRFPTHPACGCAPRRDRAPAQPRVRDAARRSRRMRARRLLQG
jgi:hypothetical protein